MGEIEFKVCYHGGWVGWFLAYFMLSPYAVFILGNGVSFLYGSDGAFFLTYNVSVSIALYGAYFLAMGLDQKRPQFAQDCGWDDWGLPDVSYVTSMTMVLILAFVGLIGQTRIRAFSGVFFFLFASLYTFSAWFHEYMSTTQVLYNASLVLSMSALFSVVYIKVLCPCNEILMDIPPFSWIGVNNLLNKPLIRQIE